MINLRIIARAFSQVLIVEGLFMVIAGVVSLLYREVAASSLFYSALITIVTGLLVFTPLRNTEKVYGSREGYIIITGIWVIFSAFGTIPFLFTNSVQGFTDAFFESVSGFTTTGATVFADVESLPKGILFWRSLTQWLGGVGIIILSLYVLPVIKTLNIQLPTTEFSGQMTDKIHPKVTEAAKRLLFIYCVLTLVEIIFLFSGKMPLFDAVCHSFSTLSTGGFSTRNDGIAAFRSPYIKIIITIFMFVAGTNLTIFYFAFKNEFRKIVANSEFRYYSILVFGFSSVVVLAVLTGNNSAKDGDAILSGVFQTVSVITTTGYYTHGINQWSSFLLLIFLILMFTGGMAGSTSGGLKIERLLITIKNNRKELRRLIHPNAYLPVKLGKKTVPPAILLNLLVFISLYLVIVCAGTLVLSLMDYDILTALGTSASMTGNIGPGLGSFGPGNNYSGLPMTGKWFLAAQMIIGRLELLTVVLLFTRSFYKR